MEDRRFVICDIEATGLEEDREIIELALITYQNGKVIEVYETLVNPLKPLNSFVKDLTMISDRDLENAPKFYEIAEAIRMRLEGATFVAHNIEFDYQLLMRKFSEMGEVLKLKTFCTLKVAQQEIPGLKNYNLDALCHFFGIKTKTRHRALTDAMAGLELFKELYKLRLKISQKVFYLPHHKKVLDSLPHRAGLLKLRRDNGKLIHAEATQNISKVAYERLMVRPENKYLLTQTAKIEFEVTGSPLIGEFKQILLQNDLPRWGIVELAQENGEKLFKIRPYSKKFKYLWHFNDYLEARKKLKELELALKNSHFAYRDSIKTKDEILSHNRKFDSLVKDAKFPAENILVLGEGRTMGERSLILIRQGHVCGYGYTEASEQEINEAPEKFLNHRFFRHLGADLSAKRYLRELKNMRQKTDSWRALAGQS